MYIRTYIVHMYVLMCMYVCMYVCAYRHARASPATPSGFAVSGCASPGCAEATSGCGSGSSAPPSGFAGPCLQLAFSTSPGKRKYAYVCLMPVCKKRDEGGPSQLPGQGAAAPPFVCEPWHKALGTYPVTVDFLLQRSRTAVGDQEILQGVTFHFQVAASRSPCREVPRHPLHVFCLELGAPCSC